jgi:hypothetical protein
MRTRCLYFGRVDLSYTGGSIINSHLRIISRTVVSKRINASRPSCAVERAWCCTRCIINMIVYILHDVFCIETHLIK